MFKIIKKIKWDVLATWTIPTIIFWTIIILLLLQITCGSSEGAEKDAWLTLKPRAWSTTEKINAFYFMIGQSIDAYSTERSLDNPNSYETNIIMGKHPSDKTIVVYFSLTGIATIILAHFSPKIRKYLLFSGGTLGISMGINNQKYY